MKDEELNKFFDQMIKCNADNHPPWVTPNSNFISFRQEGYLHLMNISFDFVVSVQEAFALEVIPEKMQVKRRLSVVE